MLEMLSDQLEEAQSMPLGSEPAPPSYNFRRLRGTERAELFAKLDEPKFCKPEVTPCSEATLWFYVWGPPAPPIEEQNGYIVVQTGGPWLLVFEFSGDAVANVRWQGQR